MRERVRRGLCFFPRKHFVAEIKRLRSIRNCASASGRSTCARARCVVLSNVYCLSNPAVAIIITNTYAVISVETGKYSSASFNIISSAAPFHAVPRVLTGKSNPFRETCVGRRARENGRDKRKTAAAVSLGARRSFRVIFRTNRSGQLFYGPRSRIRTMELRNGDGGVVYGGKCRCNSVGGFTAARISKTSADRFRQYRRRFTVRRTTDDRSRFTAIRFRRNRPERRRCVISDKKISDDGRGRVGGFPPITRQAHFPFVIFAVVGEPRRRPGRQKRPIGCVNRSVLFIGQLSRRFGRVV